MKRFLYPLLLSLSVFLALYSCANRGNPTGGEKDVDPPIIIKSKPENFSTNFRGDEIIVYFDEYVKIKDLQKHLIISPPMDVQPQITPLGNASKYIKIKIKDTLKPNTTYSFNFGESIIDNNEENPYPYYKYVCSTGDYIDSLKLKGTVKDAYNYTTDAFIAVGLYEKDSTYTDSIIYKEKPKYVTSTLDSTAFELQNIKAGNYLLVAYKEENTDYIFQPKTDKIGFIKEDITIPSDSTFELKMFKEHLDFKMIRPKLISGQKILFPFEGTPDKTLKINLISTAPDNYNSTLIKDAKKDSLYYFYAPKIESDSLLFTVTNKKEIDTFTVRLKAQKIDSLILNTHPIGVLNFKDTLAIGANNPLSGIDINKISIIDKDSVQVPFTTTFDKTANKYQFIFDKTEQNRYSMTVLPGAMIDFFEQQNDTLKIKLNTKSEAEYGNIRLTLKNAKYPLRIELIGKQNGTIVSSFYAHKDQPVDLRHIPAGMYHLRVIYDTNNNNIFDTGSFLKQQQPERVSFYPEVLEIRSGWDKIIEFQLQD
ncbi:MAG: Ig-like domain-containing protein [Flavobacteriaceae bacterium]|nr:Ig-like domain-containing protein [Flavobacteriaceae bacterium]